MLNLKTPALKWLQADTPSIETVNEPVTVAPEKKERKRKEIPAEPPREFDWDSIGKKHELLLLR